MFTLGQQESQRIISRVKEISGIIPKSPIQVVTDTSQFTRIYQHQVIRLDGKDFFVRGDVYEPRFGMQDHPKFWVKRGYDLESGKMVIIKLEFHEEFESKLGTIQVPCWRSPEKESNVIALVHGDNRFMQGETLYDEAGNYVRIIDYIHGNTLYGLIYEMTVPDIAIHIIRERWCGEQEHNTKGDGKDPDNRDRKVIAIQTQQCQSVH